MSRLALLLILIEPLHAGAVSRPAPQPTLENAAAAFARLWARSDAEGVTAELAVEGLRLHLGPDREGLVGPRQARAALRDFLEPLRTTELDVERVYEAGGQPARGFVELHWTAVVSGTDDVVRYTLFAGFVREEGAWRLAEIRILP